MPLTLDYYLENSDNYVTLATTVTYLAFMCTASLWTCLVGIVKTILHAKESMDSHGTRLSAVVN